MEEKRRTVARLITRLNIGGPTLQVFLLHRSLKSFGFETTLYCGEIEPGEEEMTYLPQAKNVEPIRLKGLGRNLHPIRDLFLLWKLYRLFRKTRPDVVHTHHAKAGAVGRVAAFFAGVPVIVHTFHGNIFRGHFHPIKAKFFVWFERLLARFSSAIIAISESQRKDLAAVFRIAPPEKIRLIPLGFDLTIFDDLEERRGLFRKRFEIPPGIPLVGILARLEPVKNLRFFLEVASRVLREKPETRFVVVGDGRLRNDVENWIKELSLEKAVTLTGFIRETPEVLADLDVVALTSFSEGTPVSLIEGMAGGRAVISANAGGVKDLIEDGKTGFLIEQGDLEGYAVKLLRLLNDPELRARLGRAGREKIRSIYSGERLTADLAALYKELLEKKNSKSVF